MQFGVEVSGLGFRGLFDCKKPEQHNTPRPKRNYVVGSRQGNASVSFHASEV